jgi:hypothetical protein
MNIKKLDEKDVVFIDQPWSDEERKQFSAFLQKRKKEEKKTTLSRSRVRKVRKSV